MNRRQFLSAAAGLRVRQPPPVNIVLILVDDLGWADTTPYGADLHETPNLERLARSGVRFTRAYAAAPVCTPTRAALQSGKYPARLGMTIWRENSLRPPLDRRMAPAPSEPNLPHSEITFAELLRERGYFTAHVGKWHLGDAEHYPETQGYDVNIGGTVWGAPQTYFFPYSGTRRFGGEYRYVPGLHLGKPGEYLTDRLTSEALKLVEASRDRPFLLNLCYHTVHTPIEAKGEMVDRFRRKLAPGLNHQNPTYAAMVASLDENVGRILDKLEQLDLSSRTLVIFTSDNGGYINPFEGQQVTNNAPLRSGKGSLYEGGVRVPLMVCWPGVARPGAVCNEPAISMDLYPTILEAAGIQPPPNDGLSLRPLLESPSARLSRQRLFFHYPHYYATTTPVSSILEGDWKLLEYLEDGRLELYHLAEDLAESKNLASAMPDRARRLHARLEGWRKQVNARLPKPNPDYREKKRP